MVTTANTGSSSIDPAETNKMQTLRTTMIRRSASRFAIRAAVSAACALWLGACSTDQQIAGGPEYPADYRLRHPITLHEADQSLELFIGSNRGGLNPTQRAQVLSFGLRWNREATGGIVIDRPIGSPNERASAEAIREIASILAASGMPPRSIVVRSYPAPGPGLAATRVSYPKIAAQAGPCGVWPEDIGPSWNRDYFENQPHWNFGCATQRNLAAQVDNPADLVQPRGETAAYTMRRTTVFQKYTAGEKTGTQDSENAQSAKISDVGK
jgi:pilus assembly protein CpaD